MTINGTDLTVAVAGAAAIAWVNWYFFVAGRSIPASASTPPGDE